MNKSQLKPPTATVLKSWVTRFCQQWDVPELAVDIRVEFSSRMTRSLGRAYPGRRLIRLRHDLKGQPRAILKEVLCHELAHLVAYDRFGQNIRPHGPEWRALIKAAGFRPSLTLDVPFLQGSRYAVRRYRHTCPVCQTSRIAYRNMRRWRCGHCLDRGLGGALRVEEVQ